MVVLYSYTLKSDDLRYILWSLVIDFNFLSSISSYIAIIFGGLVLIHSYIINMGKKINAVRLISDLAALCCLLCGGIFILSANRPNKTKTAIAFDLFGYGFLSIGLQLCDAYMFLNRYKAITKFSKSKLRMTYIYIIFIIIIPYYSVYVFMPIFLDMNSQPVFYTVVYTINLWATVGYNLYFTYEFSRLGYYFAQKMV